MPDDLTTVTESSAHASVSLSPGTPKSIETGPLVDSYIWDATMINNGTTAAVLWSQYQTSNLYMSLVQQGGGTTQIPLSFSHDISAQGGHIAAVGTNRVAVVVDDMDDGLFNGQTSYSDAFLKVFDNAGHAITADISLAANAHSFEVVGLKDGTFLLRWIADLDATHRDVFFYTRYTQDGVPMSGQTGQVLPRGGNLDDLSIAADGSGGFLYAAQNSSSGGVQLKYISNTGAISTLTPIDNAESGSVSYDGSNFWCFYTTSGDQVYAAKITGSTIGPPITITGMTSSGMPKGAVLANGNLLVWNFDTLSGQITKVAETDVSNGQTAIHPVAAHDLVAFAPTPDGGALLFNNYQASGGDYDLTVAPLNTTFLESPPVVSTPPIISYTDTVAADTFVATSGAISATDDNGVSSYGISGGGSATLNDGGITYNVSKAGNYGTLYVRSSDGKYLYKPNDDAINGLTANANELFTVTATDASGLSGSATLTINLTGTNDKPIITGMTSSGQFSAGAADPIADNAYIPALSNSVSDADSPNFAGGYLLITQTSGTTNGNFVGDVANGVKAGADVASAGGVFSNGDKVYVDLTAWGGHGAPGFFQIGTVTSTTGGALRIDFNSSATPDYVTWLLKYLAYTAPTAGLRGFTLVLNDGDGGSSNPLSFSMTGIDNDPPVLSVLTPLDGATKVATNVTPQLAFNEAIQFGTTGKITLVDVGTGNVVEEFDAHTGVGTHGGSVSISGSTLTLHPSAALANSTHYAIKVDATAITDLSGNAFAGIADNTTFDFTTIGAPPTLTIVSDHATLKAGEHATVTFTFSSAPTGFAAGDISVIGGTISGLAVDPLDSKVYTATFTPAQSQSLGASISVGASTFTDADGQANGASNTVAIGGDTLAPKAASIAHATPVATLTNADSLTWRVTFSEAVTGVDAADFTVAGTSAQVTSVTAVGGNAYEVTVSGGDLAGLNGTVTLAVAGTSDIADASGNSLASTTPTGTNDNNYTLDNTIPAPAFALAVDSGTSSTDGITKDGTVNVTLASDVASWEYSVDGGAHWSTGSGSLFTLASGSYAAGAVQVRQVDQAGNASTASNAASIVVDHASPAPSFGLAIDSGKFATDGISSDGTVNVTLALDAASWEYSLDGGASWHGGTDASFNLPVGTYAANAVQVRQTDAAGNVSAPSTNAAPMKIDTSVAAPSFTLPADIGSSTSDGITSSATVNVTLASDVASWEYSVDKGASWTAGTGSSFRLPDGSYAAGDVQVRQTDLAGNLSTPASSAAALTIDTIVATPALALAADTGASTNDGITHNPAVNVTLAPDAASWEYSTDAGLTWHTGTAASFDLAPGTYAAGAVKIRQTDVAGNLSVAASNAAPITIDTSVAAPSLSIAGDTGTSTSDGITSNATVNVTLASDAASWKYSLDAGATWTAGSGTSFTLADGSYASGQVQVCQTDVAGNQSAAASLAAAVVVDTHAPTASAIDRAALRQPAGSASFTIAVHYTDGGAGIDAATLGKDDITVTGPGSVGALAVQGVQYDAATGIATYTVAAPGAGWSAAAHAGTYMIGLAANQVRDVAGNALAANASAASFEVSFNASPVIGSNGGGASATVELAENTAAVTTVSATDDDHETVAYSISGGADAALFAIDAATGVLTFRSKPLFATPADADHDNSYLVEVTASDGNGGTDVQALTVKVLSDLDGDGTPDTNDSDIDNDGRPNSIEDAVRSPFGGNGDGNGDGVADSHQLNVASLPTVVSGTPYVTLAVGAGLSLSGVTATVAPGGLPRSAKMPFGQFDFTIGQLVPGATTEVSIYVDATPQVNGYFKQNGSGAWVNIAKSITTVGDKVKITFDLTDGGIYDSDHTVNGSITDPGGAVLVTPLIGSNGGATTALVDVDENQEAVTTIHADALGHVTYSISGGADAGRFTIDANTGALRFTNAPNYENPQDQGDTVHNNTYVVQVSASDQYGSDIQLLTVRVNDVDETPRGNTEYVDGTPVQTGTVTNPDGTTSHTITVPVVVPGRVDQVGGNNVADIPLVTNGAGAPVLSVQVPTGLGLQVSGTPAPQPAGNSLTDLIREIKAHTVAGSSDQATMTDGGSGFLSSLPTDTPLLVHSIVPTAPAAGAPGTPLVISGVPHAAGTPDTALVIDTRGLPSGVAIELQDVSFAAVAGSAHVTSGAGSQTIWGDGANQSIVLGAGDDVVHAGGGDDLVVSGVGNNYIDGGSGNDTVGLAGASRADYNLRIHDGKLVMTALNGGGGTDVVANVENLRFAGGADVSFGATDVGALVRMYDTLFGRRPDEGGINFWLNASEHAHSMHEIAAGFVNSNEAQQRYGSFSNAQFVDMLYKVGMERQAGVQELAYWTERLDSGAVDRAGLLVEFAQSAEKVALVGVITTSVETL